MDKESGSLEEDQRSKKKLFAGRCTVVHPKYRSCVPKKIESTSDSYPKYGPLPLMNTGVLDVASLPQFESQAGIKSEDCFPTTELPENFLKSVQCSARHNCVANDDGGKESDLQVSGGTYDSTDNVKRTNVCSLNSPTLLSLDSDINHAKEVLVQGAYKVPLSPQGLVQQDDIGTERLTIVPLKNPRSRLQWKEGDGDSQRQNFLEGRIDNVHGTSHRHFSACCEEQRMRDDQISLSPSSRDIGGKQPMSCGNDLPKMSSLEDGFFPLVYCKKPPSAEHLLGSFESYNIHSVDHGRVFYGKPEDIPDHPAIMAGLMFEVQRSWEFVSISLW